MALRFCFLIQKHVHSWWYRHQLKIGRCSRVCPVMEGSFRGIAQNGLRDPTFFLLFGPQEFFLCLQDRMMTTQNSVFLTGDSGVGKAGGVGWVPSCLIPNRSKKITKMSQIKQPSCGILGRPLFNPWLKYPLNPQINCLWLNLQMVVHLILLSPS